MHAKKAYAYFGMMGLLRRFLTQNNKSVVLNEGNIYTTEVLTILENIFPLFHTLGYDIFRSAFEYMERGICNRL